MKKIHIIEAVQGFFQSDLAGDQKAIYHPEEIKTALNNVFNDVVYNTWLNGKQFSDFGQLDAWSRVYECDIEDQVGTVAHAFLPFAPIQLPDGMGIRQVCDHDDNTNVFAPVEATSNAIFSELEVYTMDATPTYRLEQNNLFTGAGESSHKLVLEKLPVAPDAITSVDAMLVVPMDQIDDYDDIALPSGLSDSIVRKVIELMSQKPAPDTLNDAVIKSPNTTTP